VAARVSSAFTGRKLLVDNSAFQRGGNEIVRADWLAALEEGYLYRSPILEFEVLYSARNAREHTALSEELEALRPLDLSDAVVGAALGAQAELARHAAGFHRLPHQDYLVAALAAAHELGVLHYDADFDRIAEHSSLAFESVWIASAGTLDKEAADPLRQRRRTIGLGLAQFSGQRAGEVLDNVLDLLDGELRADGLQLPALRRSASSPAGRSTDGHSAAELTAEPVAEPPS
jgi:predicted nucleic acid-binding protein